jgi:Rrf2 family iron-sulfur cluster assembly transcriptional regulator
MKISTTVGYAVAALLQLANHRSDSPLSTAMIASDTGMPERYLLQIMKTLKDAGLVAATRGVKGGYKLAKPISQISLQHVCAAIDGPHMPEELAIQALTAASQRVLINLFSDIADDERRHLGGFTLDALKSRK